MVEGAEVDEAEEGDGIGGGVKEVVEHEVRWRWGGWVWWRWGEEVWENVEGSWVGEVEEGRWVEGRCVDSDKRPSSTFNKSFGLTGASLSSVFATTATCVKSPSPSP